MVLKNSFVLGSGGVDDQEQLQVAKVLHLFQMCGGGEGPDEGFAFFIIWSALKVYIT